MEDQTMGVAGIEKLASEWLSKRPENVGLQHSLNTYWILQLFSKYLGNLIFSINSIRAT